jgi:hypothetical protein
MGEGYEPWIKATLISPTFEATPKNAETADWRRLDASPEITWEMTRRTNHTTWSNALSSPRRRSCAARRSWFKSS